MPENSSEVITAKITNSLSVLDGAIAGISEFVNEKCYKKEQDSLFVKFKITPAKIELPIKEDPP
mgnify:CR=1 FL=1